MARELVQSSRKRPFGPIGFGLRVCAIAANTFLESIRQPIFCIIIYIAMALIVISPHITWFTVQNSPKLVTDMGLATVMLAGVLLAAFSASSVIAEEIENKTVLTIVAKPVGRTTFILGKFAGVSAGLIAAIYLLSLVLVLTAAGGASEADIEQELSLGLVGAVFGAIFLSVCYGVYCNFFRDKPFPSRAVGAAAPLFTIIFLVFAFLDPREYEWGAFGTGVSVQVIFGCVMILWAVLILASVAVAASTRLAAVVNVAACSGVFLLGLLSDFLFKSGFSKDLAVAKVLYRFVPNLQVFWVADFISADVNIKFRYVAACGGYALSLVVAFLFLAMALFQERQLA